MSSYEAESKECGLHLQACEHARSLQPSQVPLILWSFAMLNYNPLVAVLAALDQQVERLSSQITAQVCFSTCRPFHAVQYSDAMQGTPHDGNLSHDLQFSRYLWNAQAFCVYYLS